MDQRGPYSFKAMTARQMYMVRARLARLEGKTLAELPATCEAVATHRLSGTSQQRLIKVGQEDVDSLFTLSFSPSQRIWCIPKGSVLALLWWHPDNSVCPELG